MLRTRSLRCAALPSVRHGPAHHLRRPRRRAPLGVSLLEVRRPYHQPVSLSTRGFDRSLRVFFFRRAAAGSDSFHFLHFFFFGRQCRNPILGPTRQEYVRQHFPPATFLRNISVQHFAKKLERPNSGGRPWRCRSRSRSGATIDAHPSSTICDRRPLFLCLSVSLSL